MCYPFLEKELSKMKFRDIVLTGLCIMVLVWSYFIVRNHNQIKDVNRRFTIYVIHNPSGKTSNATVAAIKKELINAKLQWDITDAAVKKLENRQYKEEL